MGRVTHADTQRMMTYLLSQRENVAKYYVTVTAGQTHTIQSLGVSAATVVDWGDGLSNEYTGTAKGTHIYSNAGTYCVKIYSPENVTAFDLRDGAAVSVINSADIKSMVNMNRLMLYNMSAVGLFNSSDFIEWESSAFNLWSLNNITGNFDSSDIVNLNAVSFRLFSCNNLESVIDTKDFAGWTNIEIFVIDGLKTSSIIISESSIENWTKINTIYMTAANIPQSQIDLLLLEIYQINRVGINGIIQLTGNAAPSGTFQPATSCPVTSATPGKEVAHELLNDGCGKGINKWATVSTN